MKKIIVIPDSFKGTISSKRACEIIKEGILEVDPQCEIVTIPIADGGEGTVDTFIEIFHSDKIFVKCTGPFEEEIEAYYTIVKKTAIIEMASVAGITLPTTLNPTTATTFGLGNLMKDALSRGVNKIILALGGSCTNDAGIGMALSLGCKFYNEENQSFIPTPLTMKKIKRIENQEVEELLRSVEVVGMCDITNPLCGKNGASYVFAPQKGATQGMVEQLEDNLCHIGKIFDKWKQRDIIQATGSGAAGGLGAGVMAFLNGRLESGIHLLLDLIDFNELIKESDLIITGEGKFDSQSLEGKVIDGIANRASKFKVPLVVICGGYDTKLRNLKEKGIDAVFSINVLPVDLSISKQFCETNLKSVVYNIFSLCQIRENNKK